MENEDYKTELKKKMKERIKQIEGNITLVELLLAMSIFCGLFIISYLLFDTPLEEHAREYTRVLGKPYYLDY